MIIELVEIDVTPEAGGAFEAAVTEARPLFDTAPGCLGMALHRSIEAPNRYWLTVRWNSVEDHTVAFRTSPAFAEWRRLAGPHFLRPPRVEHLELSVGAF